MQWLCPKCHRPVSVHLSRCPHCDRSAAEAAQEGTPGSGADSASVNPADLPRPDSFPDPALPTAPLSTPSNPSGEAAPSCRPLSAIDVIPSAFKRTTARLFHPWRWAYWVRYALLCLATGEFAGFGWTGTGNLNIPNRRLAMKAMGMLQPAAAPTRFWLQSPLIFAGISAGLLILGLLWIYVASVCRFILFDAVLADRCRLREGWRRWRTAGRRLFGWELVLGFSMLAILLLVIGIPLLLAWRAGVFRDSREHFGMLLGGGVLLVLLAVLFLLAGALVNTLAIDFLVPLLALERLRIMEAWRRLLGMIRREKAAYLGYILMKIVFTVGSAVIFGIVTLLVLVIPIILLTVIVVAVPLGGIHWNAFTIGVAGLLGILSVLALVFAVALVSAPSMVFFEAYALHFFGSRYEPLGSALNPAPAALPSAATSG